MSVMVKGEEVVWEGGVVRYGGELGEGSWPYPEWYVMGGEDMVVYTRESKEGKEEAVFYTRKMGVEKEMWDWIPAKFLYKGYVVIETPYKKQGINKDELAAVMERVFKSKYGVEEKGKIEIKVSNDYSEPEYKLVKYAGGAQKVVVVFEPKEGGGVVAAYVNSKGEYSYSKAIPSKEVVKTTHYIIGHPYKHKPSGDEIAIAVGLGEYLLKGGYTKELPEGKNVLEPNFKKVYKGSTNKGWIKPALSTITDTSLEPYNDPLMTTVKWNGSQSKAFSPIAGLEVPDEFAFLEEKGLDSER